MLLAVKTIPRLSREGCFRLAQIVGTLGATLDRRGRRVALSNLEAAFGSQFSAVRRSEIVRESYQIFVRTMLDLMWTPRLNAQNHRQWIDVENLDEVLKEIGPSGNCIFATFHYGNFEWAAQAVGHAGVPVSILAQEFKNPLLDPIFERLREQAGHELAGRAGAIMKLYKALRRGRNVAILTDLTLRPQQPSVIVSCFGLKTCVTYAHAWLHKRTGAPIYPGYCEPLPNGRWRFVMQPKLDIPENATDAEIAQLCWNRFEPLVRVNPAPWLWMYKHWRYRPASADRPYPFYANEGWDFEELLTIPGKS